MKKNYAYFAILVCLGLLLSACSGEIYYDPQAAAGNPVAPAVQATANAVGPQASQTSLFDTVNMQALVPLKTFIDFETGMVLESFQDPGTLQGALLIYPTSATLALTDGPGIGPADIVALFTVGVATFFVCRYLAQYAAQAVGQITAADWQTWNQYMESHTISDHSPDIEGSKARANITAFLAAMAAYLAGNGPDPRNKCGVTRDAAGVAIRAAVWVAEGYLIWFHINTPGTPMRGPWGGSYNITAENFDKDRNAQFERDRGWTWEAGVPCDSIPGGVPSFLQAAQP